MEEEAQPGHTEIYMYLCAYGCVCVCMCESICGYVMSTCLPALAQGCVCRHGCVCVDTHAGVCSCIFVYVSL